MNHRSTITYQQADKAGKAKLDKIAKLPPLERMLYFVEERENVRFKKEAGEPKPWTDDPILQSFRFCCPRRMDDRVSQFLLKTWYEPYFDHPNMLLAVVLARHFNQPTTLEYLGFPEKWTPKIFYARLLKMKKEFLGRSVFNGAYMIRSSSNSSPHFYPDKCEMVIKETVQQFVDNPPNLNTDSMEECVNEIMKYRNFGTFMAGQVVSDLRWAISGKWKDIKVWAPIGPGSRRGFNRLFERDLKYPLKQDQFLEELQQVSSLVRVRLPESMTKRWEAIDIQNISGCEWDKAERGLWGQGQPKQRYPGQGIQQ